VTALGKRQQSLRQSAQRGAEATSQLKARLAAAQAAEDARKELAAFGARRGKEPGAVALFPWQWEKVEALQKGLSGYSAALRRQLALVEGSVGDLREAASTTGAEANSWSARTAECALAGSWSGTQNVGGNLSGLTLQLTQSGEGWGGSAQSSGPPAAVASVKLSGTHVVISLRDGKGTLTGVLSDNGKALAGSLASSEGPATFELRKHH
jgi:hypothetical protein